MKRVRLLAGAPTLFASLFATTPQALFVEPGHYDPESQVYVSDRTGQPAYVKPNSAADAPNPVDTTGSTCSITTMTGKSESRDDHADTVQDDFDN